VWVSFVYIMHGNLYCMRPCTMYRSDYGFMHLLATLHSDIVAKIAQANSRSKSGSSNAGYHTTSSVIHSNVNVLLAGWQDLLFPLPLQGRQLLHRFLDDRKSTVDLLFRNNKRRRETDDVLVCRFRLSIIVSVIELFTCAILGALPTNNPFSLQSIQRSHAL
jgi:hypothetical protein